MEGGRFKKGKFNASATRPRPWPRASAPRPWARFRRRPTSWRSAPGAGSKLGTAAEIGVTVLTEDEDRASRVALSLPGPGLFEQLQLRVADEHRVCRRHRDRPVDAKDGDLELVAGLEGGAEHHQVWHVVARDGGGSRITRAARDHAIDPDFGVILHRRPEYRHGAGWVECADLGRDRQRGAIPHEGNMAAAAARVQT